MRPTTQRTMEALRCIAPDQSIPTANAKACGSSTRRPLLQRDDAATIARSPRRFGERVIYSQLHTQARPRTITARHAQSRPGRRQSHSAR